MCIINFHRPKIVEKYLQKVWQKSLGNYRRWKTILTCSVRAGTRVHTGNRSGVVAYEECFGSLKFQAWLSRFRQFSAKPSPATGVSRMFECVCAPPQSGILRGKRGDPGADYCPSSLVESRAVTEAGKTFRVIIYPAPQ